MDFQKLKSEIRVAAEGAFREVRSRYPEEEFCGYALYSDADAGTVCPSVNTWAHFEDMIAGHPEDAEYYRWSPAEWKHEFEGAAEHFDELSTSLFRELDAIKSPEDHHRFKRQVYECCVAVLEDMKRDGFFEDIGESGVLVFAISDTTNESECDWIDRLNTTALAARFRKWFTRR